MRNTLGYEWTLLKKVEGVPLEQEWRAIPLDAKTRISEKLAAYTLELRALTFDKIGSLYFRNTDQNSSTQDPQQIKFMSDSLEKMSKLGRWFRPFSSSNDDSISLQTVVHSAILTSFSLQR